MNNQVSTGSDALSLPKVNDTGLTEAEVHAQIEAGHVNKVNSQTSRSVRDIVRENVFTLFNVIIFVAVALVLITGQWKDAVFGLVIVINAGIGIVTELRAKRTLDKLSILVSSKSVVRRAGRDVKVAHDDIVLGDLLWIRAGEQVPADATIVKAWGLELDESMLTGESRTVRKGEGDKAYSGSNAVSGLALARVEAVGDSGYAAKLTAKAKVYKKTVSDLSRGINTILKVMTVVVVPLCFFLLASQIRAVGGWSEAFADGAWRQALVSSVAGVVGMIPEGLVLLTSLNFAIAAMRLAKQHTLMQHLESVETLARVDAINLDKTGTITDGGIVFEGLVSVDVGDHPVTAVGDTAAVAALAADSSAVSMYADDTNAASTATTSASAHVQDLTQARQALYDLSNEENPNGTGSAVLQALGTQGVVAGTVEARVPFSSGRKFSAIVRDGDVWYLGAPEVLLGAFSDRFPSVRNTVEQYAGQGRRVLLVARAERAIDGVSLTAAAFADDPRILPSAKPVALALCSEHIREDAQETLAWFREQGVRCRVISGDNPTTVAAIARKVKLTGDREPVSMDARELPDDTKELAQILNDVDVLGRVLPEQKKAIVDALHANKNVVAMTGDGVNDALALKEADLGIAMGNAAPATKAVADVVLVDSKFSHLPDVVARGRQVMANMERVASLFLVKTVYSTLIAIGVVCTFVPFPYLPRHITYIGALTIGAPAFILALAPNTRRYMPGFLGRVVRFALPGGISIALTVLLTTWLLPGVMGWDLRNSGDQLKLHQISAMIIFVMGIMVLARVARPLHSWRGWLVAVFAGIGVVGMFVPVVANFFELTFPLGWTLVAMLVCVGLGVVLFVGIQTIGDFIGNVYRRVRSRFAKSE
jgi:cation-transporting P-type ATPase E